MKYKYQLCLFDALDNRSIENKLNGMMEKGYELVETGSIFWVFKKCKPNSKKYAAVLHEESVEWESGIDEFDEYCKEAGWIKIAKLDKAVIYVNENMNAVDISTEPSLEYDNIKKYIKKSILSTSIFAVTIIAYIIISSLRIKAPILDLMSDYNTIFLAGLMVLVICIIVSVDIFSILWALKSKKMMKDYSNYLETSFLSRIYKIEAVALLLYFLVFLVIFCIVGKPYTALNHLSYLLFMCVIMAFLDKAINQITREDQEEKKRKIAETIVKGIVLVVAIVLMVISMGDRTIETYDSEGTIWLYKDEKVLWPGEGHEYEYELYYPKSDEVYDFVLDYIENHNEDGDIIREKDGNIFVIEEGTPLEYQEMILEKTVNF